MKPIRLLSRLVVLLSALVAAHAPAQTVEFTVLFKSHIYTQTDDSTVVERASNPWEFRAMVNGTGLTSTNPVSTVTFNPAAGSTSPNPTTLGFDGGDNGWEFTQLFAAQTGSFSLNETFAAGDYTFNVGAHSVTLTFSGDLYPNHPVISNNVGTWIGGALHVDPTQPLTLASNTFGTNFSSGNSRVGMDLFGPGYNQSLDTAGSGFTAGSASMNIGANSFTPGQYYDVSVEFNRFVDMDALPVLGGQAIATYTSVLEFKIYAIPEPSAYAAIFGGLALVGVVLHRRRRLA